MTNLMKEIGQWSQRKCVKDQRQWLIEPSKGMEGAESQNGEIWVCHMV
jgi:hypothetical protein